ncbi:MAG: diaminopimelate decarboxylase [Gammaproteobacteria bacterium 39-13]|nr:diaminopimelate decarboxylase [Gammaproteobacteria bacterium]OJV89985.1 MAG: diaminopimelate decarboxylase [Gammaproteobacteria bacterium 39-13]
MDYFTYQNNQLWAESTPLLQIAQSVGTPCYVYSDAALTTHWTAFDKAFSRHPHQIHYAVKANSNLCVLNTLAQLGSGFDIVSAGELTRVLSAGGLAQKVVFSGVGKQPDEIAHALEKNIFCFNVESEAELMCIHRIAEHLNVQAPISFRVNPDIDAKSHPYISTGSKENKFGIDIGEAPRLYQLANQLNHLTIKGIACHIGSQLTSLSPIIKAFNRLLLMTHQLNDQGIKLQHLDIGGGLGVRYRDETPPSPAEYANALLKHPVSSLTLLLEPGRAIAANAGVLITKVLYIKKSSHKHFCIVDCAMNDLIRPTLYSAWQDIVPLELNNTGSYENYDVVGPVCESGDFLGKERRLNIQAGDYLAIKSAGAYGFTMSSNYNSRPRCAEVMVKQNQYQVIRARESIEDLLAKERIWS